MIFLYQYMNFTNISFSILRPKNKSIQIHGDVELSQIEQLQEVWRLVPSSFVSSLWSPSNLIPMLIDQPV